MRIKEPGASADKHCFIRYDALGRVVLKHTPAKVSIDPDIDAALAIAFHGNVIMSPSDYTVIINVLPLNGRKLVVRLNPTRGFSGSQLRGLAWALSYNAKCSEAVISSTERGVLVRQTDDDEVLLANVKNVTFRSIQFRGLVRVNDCENVTFDGCTFGERSGNARNPDLSGGLRLEEKQKNVRFTNCTIYEAVRLFRIESDPSVLFAHNLFEVKRVKNAVDTMDPTDTVGRTRHFAVYCTEALAPTMPFVLYNNVVLCHDGDRTLQDTLMAPCWKSVEAGNFVTCKKDNKTGVFRSEVLALRSGTSSHLVGCGTADTPARKMTSQPVLWDARGMLRDLKEPRIGPRERLASGRLPTVTHRYAWKGRLRLHRETQRYSSGVADVTSFVYADPERGGHHFFVDSDGRLDFQATDHTRRICRTLRHSRRTASTSGSVPSISRPQMPARNGSRALIHIALSSPSIGNSFPELPLSRRTFSSCLHRPLSRCFHERKKALSTQRKPLPNCG